MAGIGFNLQKILEGDTFLDSIKAHFYSALICAGPWLLSITTIFCLTYFAPQNIDIFELNLFRGVIIYVFAYSLVSIGIFHFPLTRYLADKLYAKEEESIIPVFNTVVLMVMAFQGFSSILFFLTADMKLALKVMAIMTYITVSVLWILMIFLTALRDYRTIAVSYLAGSITAIVLSLWLGRLIGLEGYFLGYLTGHFLIAVLWSGHIFVEFNTKRMFDSGFFVFMMRHKTLILIGSFYNLAIWIDKIIFWYSPHATSILPQLRIFPPYDSAIFFAYLTIIPALSIFMIQIETDFYKLYRRYYTTILDKASYQSIQRVKMMMAAQLRRSTGILIRYQGILSILVIAFAPQVADMLHIPWMQVPIFRVTVVAAFLHALLLMVMIITLYFDFQDLALRLSVVFLVSNGVLTWVTTRMEMLFFGYGYLTACLISLMFAFYMLDYRFKRLEYFTFAKQPVGVHREEEVG